MFIGDIVTVLTVSGEFVGKLQSSLNDPMLKLKDPRMLVHNEQGMGFARGVCVSGEAEAKEVTFSNYVMVVKTDQKFADAWMQATSGLVLAKGTL